MARQHITGSRRSLPAAVATAVLAVGGLVGTTVALGTQRHAPQPPLTVLHSATPSPAPHEARADTRSAVPTTVGPILASSVPLKISIPAIGVQSELLRLGLTPGGALEVPAPGPNYDTAGWYENSPTPGALGPAVIAGHVDSAADGPSVFFRLGGLHPGDAVLISRTDHTVAAFRVDAVLRYHKAAFPTQVVYGDTDHAALRLITCGGPFDSSTGHYTDDVVVLASLSSASNLSQRPSLSP